MNITQALSVRKVLQNGTSQRQIGTWLIVMMIVVAVTEIAIKTWQLQNNITRMRASIEEIKTARPSLITDSEILDDQWFAPNQLSGMLMVKRGLFCFWESTAWPVLRRSKDGNTSSENPRSDLSASSSQADPSMKMYH
jgi:hypothetical protein